MHTGSLYVDAATSPNLCGPCWRVWCLSLPPERPKEFRVALKPLRCVHSLVYAFFSVFWKKKWIPFEPRGEYGLIITAQQTYNVMSLLEHLHVLAVESYLEETISRQTQSQFTFCVVCVFTSAKWNTADPSGRAVYGWVCGRSLAGIAGLNPAGAWMFVSCTCCLLSGGLCVGPITRPEETPVWCVWVWSWTLDRWPWSSRGSCAIGEKKLKCFL